MSEQKHTCEALSRGSTWSRYACGKPAKFFEKHWGKEQWFCGLHAPSVKIRRREERRAERDRVMGPIWDAEAKATRIRDAAPDLLAALKLVQAALESQRDVYLGNGDNLDYEAIDAAQAAIAKAEGR